MALIVILLLTVIIPDTYIKGRILDQQEQPVSEVNIHILDSNYFTVSDQDGFFLINTNKDTLTIEFSHIKYKNKILDINLENNQNLSIFLVEDSIDLGESVFTGLRSQTYIKNTPILTHVITSDEIKKSAYSSVKEALEMTLPNVQNVMSSHAGISNEEVKIQGLDNKYLLFLVDGKRVSGEFAGNLDFKMLDLSNVDRIEIVEGGMSSLYGSSAIGGVVNIITKKHTQPFQINYSYLYDNPMINVHSLNMGLVYKNLFYFKN